MKEFKIIFDHKKFIISLIYLISDLDYGKKKTI